MITARRFKLGRRTFFLELRRGWHSKNSPFWLFRKQTTYAGTLQSMWLNVWWH